MSKQQEQKIKSLEEQIAYLEEKKSQYKDVIHHLQPIVDKCFLNSSDYRKRFLTVGSEWECVADCYGEHSAYRVGIKVVVSGIDNLYGKYINVECGNIDDNMPKDQFLLCFKPKGE